MRFKRFFVGAYVLPLFCFFCAYLFFFSLFLHVCSCCFFLLFSNLGLDWVLLFFFRGFETSHWVTVRKDFDKV